VGPVFRRLPRPQESDKSRSHPRRGRGPCAGAFRARGCPSPQWLQRRPWGRRARRFPLLRKAHARDPPSCSFSRQKASASSWFRRRSRVADRDRRFAAGKKGHGARRGESLPGGLEKVVSQKGSRRSRFAVSPRDAISTLYQAPLPSWPAASSQAVASSDTIFHPFENFAPRLGVSEPRREDLSQYVPAARLDLFPKAPASEDLSRIFVGRWIGRSWAACNRAQVNSPITSERSKVSTEAGFARSREPSALQAREVLSNRVDLLNARPRRKEKLRGLGLFRKG